MKTLALIIPVFNAPDLAARIASHVPSLSDAARGRGYELVEVIFSDDGSYTPLSLPPSDPRIRIIRSEKNMGKGHAVKTAALASRADWVLMSDVDESAPLAEFSKLADSAQDAWIVCGSRWRRPGVPFLRRLLSAFFHPIVRISGVKGVHDTQCGFKLFNMEKMRPVFNAQKIFRFAFDVELLLAAQRAGGKIVEVPIVWRGGHRSSLRVLHDAPRMLWDVLRLKLSR